MPRRLFNLLAAVSLVVCAVELSRSCIFVAAILAVVPAWRFIEWRRREIEQLRRIDYGLCHACGAALRSSEARCPTCRHPRGPYDHVRLRNVCPTCGYDLRATPDRCPECGTVLTAPIPA